MRFAICLVLCVGIGDASAQTERPPAATAPAFEVVSIKQNKNGGHVGAVRPEPGGRFVMVNAPIARLLRVAYPSESQRLVGAPAWVNSDRYDIVAKADGEPSAQTMEAMLRTLLAERLKLVAHFEPQEQDVYALVVARADRRLGAGLKPSTLDCAQLVERSSATGLNMPPRSNGAPPCGLASDGRKLSSGGLTMAQLARNISAIAGRVVVDKTDLDGYYEFDLEYAARQDNSAGVPAADDNRPSIFSALQEQLGLRLEPQRAPLEVLVVDQISRPTED